MKYLNRFKTSVVKDYIFEYEVPSNAYTRSILKFIISKLQQEINNTKDIIKNCQIEIAYQREKKMNILKEFAYNEFMLKPLEEERNKAEYMYRKTFWKKDRVKNNIDINELKENIKISDILGEPVRKDGRRWWYQSWERREKIPSVCYYLDTNSFYDFGSGTGGTVIDLYMNYNNCSLKEAISELTQQYLK